MQSRLLVASPMTAAAVDGPYPAIALLALSTDLTARQLSTVAGSAAAFSQGAVSHSMMDRVCQCIISAAMSSSSLWMARRTEASSDGAGNSIGMMATCGGRTLQTPCRCASAFACIHTLERYTIRVQVSVLGKWAQSSVSHLSVSKSRLGGESSGALHVPWRYVTRVTCRMSSERR